MRLPPPVHPHPRRVRDAWRRAATARHCGRHVSRPPRQSAATSVGRHVSRPFRPRTRIVQVNCTSCLFLGRDAPRKQNASIVESDHRRVRPSSSPTIVESDHRRTNNERRLAPRRASRRLVVSVLPTGTSRSAAFRRMTILNRVAPAGRGRRCPRRSGSRGSRPGRSPRRGRGRSRPAAAPPGG